MSKDEHTHPNQKAATYKHTETTHPYNVNLKLAFLKVASFHPHYNIYTADLPPPRHQFRSYLMQMTSPSHLHTHTSTSSAKKYIQPYTVVRKKKSQCANGPMWTQINGPFQISMGHQWVSISDVRILVCFDCVSTNRYCHWRLEQGC